MGKQKIILTVRGKNPRSAQVLEALARLGGQYLVLEVESERQAKHLKLEDAEVYALYDFKNCNLVREVEPTGKSVPAWAHGASRCFKIGPSCDTPERAQVAAKVILTAKRKEPRQKEKLGVYSLADMRPYARAKLSLDASGHLRQLRA